VLLVKFYKLFVEQDARINHKIPLLSVSAGILSCAGCMLRYGILPNGPAGISIPIGIPFIIILGWNQYRQIRKEDPIPDGGT
jgi:hypothetical protein